MRDYLLNFLCFTDLTQGEATINEKNLQVDKNYATLEDKTEIDGEMYVLQQFVTNDTDFVIIGFEADEINLLQSFFPY